MLPTAKRATSLKYISGRASKSQPLKRSKPLQDYGQQWEERRVKNTFGALELHGNPSEIKASLAFKHHLAIRDEILAKFRALNRNVGKKVRYVNF